MPAVEYLFVVRPNSPYLVILLHSILAANINCGNSIMFLECNCNTIHQKHSDHQNEPNILGCKKSSAFSVQNKIDDFYNTSINKPSVLY